MKPLILLPDGEYLNRMERVREALTAKGIDALLVTDNANTYYLTGRVFAGYIYIPAKGEEIFFVKRPTDLQGDKAVYIRKPEQITESIGLNMPSSIGLELDVTPWSTVERLKNLFPGSELKNGSPLLRSLRAIKTEYEIKLLKESGTKHEYVYRQIPGLFKEGMTDLELQVEIERLSRLEGCLGQFRISGDTMELYMGNVLAGENADTPSPYDFAMGGGGLNPSLPVGCNGGPILRGMTVMVDMNGDYSGYMTDMTRTFAFGKISEEAIKAHELSIRICHELAKSKPGSEAKALYERAEEMAREAGFGKYFMGHAQKAGFIGHGVGIEINELPVIAPRSKDVLEEGNVIALEPKFVLPKIGAVGIENTYVVRENGMECITKAPEELIYFSE